MSALGLALALAASAPLQPADGVVPARLENPNLPPEIAPPDFGALPAFPLRAPESPPIVAREVPLTAAAMPTPTGLLTGFQLDQTHLQREGHKGFGIDDTDVTATVELPWSLMGKPLRLKGGFGAHLWDGPTRRLDRAPYEPIRMPYQWKYSEPFPGGVLVPFDERPRVLPAGPDPELPGSVYDLFLDLGWRPRFAEWLFADIGVTTGVYSDFKNFGNDAFRVRGRGLAIIALSEQFQFVAGVLYVNRNFTKLIPAGGVLWKPNDWTDYQLVFPLPKAAKRLGVVGGTPLWGYVSGEFGGGTWAYETPAGGGESVDYNDYRLIAGLELRAASGWTGKFEVGHVFGRTLEFASGKPDYQPSATWMVRAGVGF